MTSLFESVLAIGDGIIDKVYADRETFSFYPMRAGVNVKPQPDPLRDIYDGVIAVFDDAIRIDDEQYLGRTTTTPVLWVLRKYLPQGIRQFDRFWRCKTCILYEVRDVRPDSIDARLTVLLQEIAPQ